MAVGRCVISRIGDVADVDIELAHLMATTADEISTSYFDQQLTVARKEDGSLVTQADLAVEEALMGLLVRHRPDDAILSEETGAVAGGRRRWLLDPIDGTAGFIDGYEHWGTHIALEVDGEIVLGIITRPVRDLRWWAVAGQGAFRSATTAPQARSVALAVSIQPTLRGSQIGLFSPDNASPVGTRLTGEGASVVRSSYDRSTILELVEGDIDAVVSENCGAPWDHAPAVILTIEAGGSFSDPRGTRRPDLLGGVYSNGQLTDSLRRTLAGTRAVSPSTV